MTEWFFLVPPKGKVQKGTGSGRGHHGHKGRPGKVGGSLPGKGGGKATFTMAEAAKTKGKDLFESAGGARHELNKRYKFQVERPDGETDIWDIWQTYGKGRAKGSYIHVSTGFGTKHYMHFRGTPGQTLDEFKNIS